MAVKKNVNRSWTYKVKTFNRMCETPENAWFMYRKEKGYVWFKMREWLIERSQWSETKEKATIF